MEWMTGLQGALLYVHPIPYLNPTHLPVETHPGAGVPRDKQLWGLGLAAYSEFFFHGTLISSKQWK